MKAVAAAFIEIKTVKFTKKVQVDPYLEDALCSCCLLRQGPYFCRDLACFNYFCRACWELQHGAGLPHHRPIMRNTRGGGNMDRPVEPVMGMLSTPVYWSDFSFIKEISETCLNLWELFWDLGCSPKVKSTCPILYSSCNIHGINCNIRFYSQHFVQFLNQVANEWDQLKM